MALTKFSLSYFILMSNLSRQALAILQKFVILRVKIFFIHKGETLLEFHLDVKRNSFHIATFENCYLGYIIGTRQLTIIIIFFNLGPWRI